MLLADLLLGSEMKSKFFKNIIVLDVKSMAMRIKLNHLIEFVSELWISLKSRLPTKWRAKIC